MEVKQYINKIEKFVENELLINGMMHTKYNVITLHDSFSINLKYNDRGYLTPIYVMTHAEPSFYYLPEKLLETIKDEIQKAIIFLK